MAEHEALSDKEQGRTALLTKEALNRKTKKKFVRLLHPSSGSCETLICESRSSLVVMCDRGDHLERVQLVSAEVGSLGGLPQLNHSGLPELCISKKKTWSDY